jgi:hypothetical protein
MSYCFLCASSSFCSHRCRRAVARFGNSDSVLGIAWRAWLAKCVDSTPLVVARAGSENNRKEANGDGDEVVCYVGSHKGIVIAVDTNGMAHFIFYFEYFY